MDYTVTLQHVFPSELLRFFEIVRSSIQTDKATGEDFLEVVFEERKEFPEGYSKADYESKGFFECRVQDFPLRGKAVFLIVRRRRWRHKRTGEALTRDFTFLAEGTKLTAELADFLKQRGG
jgi:hypothetical protein